MSLDVNSRVVHDDEIAVETGARDAEHKLGAVMYKLHLGGVADASGR